MLVIGLRLHKTGNYTHACQMGSGESREILARALELVVMVIEMEPGFRDFGFFFFIYLLFISVCELEYSRNTTNTRREAISRILSNETKRLDNLQFRKKR